MRVLKENLCFSTPGRYPRGNSSTDRGRNGRELRVPEEQSFTRQRKAFRGLRPVSGCSQRGFDFREILRIAYARNIRGVEPFGFEWLTSVKNHDCANPYRGIVSAE